jgi:hypothetical protein
MTEQDALIKKRDWIPLKRYVKLYEDSEAAVRKRIATGDWKKGEQWSVPEGAGVWISIAGVNAWAGR